MKTIELKWIEDDNHVVAEDAYTGLQELIETGVFPNLKVKCEDDVLYITGEKEDLDKAVMKIQKAYAKYGQIMIKEAKNGTSNELRIESFDDNVQDIFNHTLNDYETFKENCKNDKPTNYITTLGKFQYKFNKLKEAASRKDKKIIQNFLTEIDELTESFEEPRLKPIKKINEGINHFHQMADKRKKEAEAKKNNTLKVTNPIAIDIYNDIIENGEVPNLKAKYKDHVLYITGDEKDLDKAAMLFNKAYAKYRQNMFKEAKNDTLNDYESTEHDLYNEEIKKQLSNPANWGIIEERLDRDTFNKKFFDFVQTYANVEDLDLDAAYDLIASNDEIYEYIDSDMTIEDIMDKISAGEIILENKKIDESFVLSPSELKKKLQRVASKWASEKGVKFMVAYDELRKKKSVKDMLDFCSVDEIIEDLKKQRKEEDDELEVAI